MKLKRLFFTTVLIIILTACGSKIKKDYIVIDSSTGSLKQPSWVKKMAYTPKKSEYKYFVSKSENINQRLCEKGAEVRTRSAIASEITSEINDTYKEVIENKGLTVDENITSNLNQNVTLYLANTEVEERYWEKRNYLQTLGADSNSKKYVCYALVKMNRENYKKVVNLSLDKMFGFVKNKEIKNEIKNKLLADDK